VNGGRSLGLVETWGFVSLVAAADAALKTAPVTLESCHEVGDGVVALVLTGSVAAVQIAVEAGASHAGRVGTLRMAHVIARPAGGVEERVIGITRTEEVSTTRTDE